MRKFAILGMLLFCCCSHSQPAGCPEYQIDILDQDETSPATILYHIADGSILIESISNGGPRAEETVLLKRSLTDAERRKFCDYFSSFNLDTLKTDYINRGIEDGDQKIVKLRIGEKSKTITIFGVYLKEMEGLFAKVNSLIEEREYRIAYGR